MNRLKSEIKSDTPKTEAPKPKKEEKREKVKDIKPKKEKNFKKTKSSGNIFISIRDFLINEKLHKTIGVIFILLSIFLLFSFISYFFTWRHDQPIVENLRQWYSTRREALNVMGLIGAYCSDRLIQQTFGITAFIIVFLLFITGIKLLIKRSILPLGKSYAYSFFILLWVCLTSGFAANFLKNSDFTNFAGGFGYQLNNWLEKIIGMPGTFLIIASYLIIFLIITVNLSFKRKPKVQKETEQSDRDEEGFTIVNYDKDGEDKSDITVKPKEEKSKENGKEKVKPKEKVKAKEAEEVELETEDFSAINTSDVELTIENSSILPEEINEEDSNTKTTPNHFTIDTPFDPKLELKDFILPSVELLRDYGNEEVNVQKDELEANKNRIINTLKNYGITIDKIKATIGPTVTLYELVPSPGIRIAKIKNLEDDIALSLSALGIRIIAPMPGKGTIGIEVPNQKPEIVSMRSVLSSEKFQNSKFELPIAIGKTISNECYIANMIKMPHILMAGATGQGKSVGLNAILTSLLFKKHPAEIKFVLVDPKKVELTLYEKIERHYLAKLPDSEEAIITDTRKVVRTLNSLCVEMENRYNLLKDAQVRNIQEYNEKFISRKLNPNEGHHFLPYIILVIDEFADLIMTAGKEIETPITRLAQLARAIGIHLIIATQRPSVNIITGTIKANFPTRIAFRVASKIDSRTILDSNGADQLIGRGDMLVSSGNELLPIRLQCAFIDIDEMERLTSFIGSQRAYPDAYHLPEFYDETDEKGEEFDSSERDEFFEDAARVIVQSQHGSTSLIQRKLKLGYNRAGRIIDQLEKAGIVGPFEGSKAREVKIKDEIGLQQLLQRLNSDDNV